MQTIENKKFKKGSIYKTYVSAEVVAEAEVIVAGGGTAGVVAALAAARNGAKTILVERFGYLGGMMTAGNAGLTKYIVHSTDKYDYSKILDKLRAEPSEIQIAGGIPMEITNELLRSGFGIGTEKTGGSYVFSSTEDFKWLLLTMLQKAKVKLLFHSWIVDVIKEGNIIKGIVIENKSGRQVILGKVIIDATGDGDIAAKSGVPFDMCKVAGKSPDKVNSLSAMGVMFKVGNVDLLKVFKYLKNRPEVFHMQSCALLTIDEACKKVKKGEMMTINIKTDFSPYFFQIYNLPMKGVVTLCCPCYHGDGTSAEDLTKAEVAISKIVHTWCKKINKIPGFNEMYLLDCPQIGVRETRRIQGRYLLTIEDIFKMRKFKDSIGRGSHPVDAPVSTEIKKHPLPSRWSFAIPYRCLVPKKISNLLTAGRCISVTHEAFGCTRSTVQCMITGQAAGTAAAICCKQNVLPPSINTDVLCKVLKSQGVVV